MEERSQNTGQTQGTSKGINIGLGGLGVELNISLNVYGIRTLVDTLTNAMGQTTDVATATVNQVVDTVNELGIENLKKWAQEGGEEARELYHQLVSKLQEAAQTGQNAAKSLLNELGEGVEATGQKMQDVAKETGTTH